VNSSDLLSAHQKIFEIPFNSKNKWMLTLVSERQANDSSPQLDPLMLVKGGPDVLFPSCTDVLRADSTATPLDSSVLLQLSALQADWSSQGQRVLALCMRTLNAFKVDPRFVSANDMEDLLYSEVQNLTLVGLIGIHDPPRSNVEDAIHTIKRAGVRTFMVTGDFKLTAVSIAKQVCPYYSFYLNS
jgi:sodium/potassium-transporting ATPase subunit alpha